MSTEANVVPNAVPDPASGTEALLHEVYGELKRLAIRRMAREGPGHTLQPTALVNEVWLRVAGAEGTQYADARQFFAAAAEAMRRILVESARRRQALKRGATFERTEFDEAHLVSEAATDELLAVEDAMRELEKADAEAAALVKLRYFVGMTMDEAAAAMGLSVRGAERLWTFGRAWLRRELRPGQF